MMWFRTRERLEIVGLMPERALLRLRRAGITLYDVKKVEKDRLRFAVDGREIDKVYAVYPKAGTSIDGYSPYTVHSRGSVGLGKYVRFMRNRVGCVLGILLFAAVTLYADGLVLGVEFSASSVYAKEAYEALETYGIKRFSRYKKGKEDLVCSRLLSLSGVEFCSVQKRGNRVFVDMRLGELAPPQPIAGDMHAKHTGTITAMTVLQGTANKRIGDSVRVGETLVHAWFSVDENTKTAVEAIARVQIECVYECVVDTDDKQTAFATAYLGAGLTTEETVTESVVQEREKGYTVSLTYTATETINF